MDDKIKILLDRLNIDNNHYPSFYNSKLTKIKVNRKNSSCTIYLSNDKMYSVEVISELEKNKNLIDKNMKDVKIVYDFLEKDINTYLSYYSIALEEVKDILRVLEIYKDKLQLIDSKFVLVANNKVEETKLNNALPRINELYHNFGLESDISVILKEEHLVRDEINKSLNDTIDNMKSTLEEYNNKIETKEEVVKPKYPTRRSTKKDPNSVIGLMIEDMPIPIHSIIGEDNNVTIWGEIFGIEYFESSKSDFKIITLKVTDYEDSIYCKVFAREDEEYKRICSELKKGKWYKIRGYVKSDHFSNDELVLNARDIVLEDKQKAKREDNAIEKRVELHAHTKMSQMDGLCDEVELVNQAISFGHKAIAITDHNGCQAFPHVFNTVTSYNKNQAEEDKFKAIYGTELTLIDDSVDIVVRPTDEVMLDLEYVVFDFETTGFNAGGKDSIIEIGAVKIKDGMITDKYDELINPGVKLEQKIIDVTSITDEMLEGKDNEENAIKRFIEWFGDLPMVAHNAKFDVSFLEMAYKKYNLGTFKNTVIDTLELSRTLDNTYARHSLSALVKRYDVPWDEESHHRGDYDAEGTALVFYKMLKKLDNRNIERMNQLDELVSRDEIHKYGKSYHVNLLATNKTGLKNLFKLISLANTKYLYKTPRILRSEIENNREGLLVGSGCYESEVFLQARSKADQELTNIIRFYDYVEVQPLECYGHLIQSGDFSNEYELSHHLRKIIRVTEEAGKLIVATGDVHHINREDKVYREIIVNQKVPGGGRHPLARNNIKEIPSNHFRTTEEMLEDFKFLEDDLLAHKIVIENPNKIADMVDIIEVIIDTGGIPFSPRVKADDGNSYLDCPVVVTELVYTKAADWYGDPLPYSIEERIATELYGDIVYKVVKDNLEKEELSKEEFEVKSHKMLHDVILSGKEKVLELVSEYVKRTSEEELDEKSLEKATSKALGGVIGGGFDPIYLIAQRLVKHSNDEGYLVGSRGSVGSSFVATMMGITEVNPLAAHYRCDKCKLSIFEDENGDPFGAEYSSGFDLPDKECPNCHIPLIKDGQDMPFATFLGFNADKVPDIDLNFSDLNQASAHAYTKVLFGEDNVYRAGTIGTVADKTAFGFVKGWAEEHQKDVRTAEIERLSMGCTGVKRTTGQHPGGIVVIPDYMEVFDFTPFQFPAEDITAEWRTTHFDYHAIDQCVLKLDILGHSDPTQLRLIQLQSGTDIMKVPLDDKETMSIFTSTDALGVTKEQIMCNTGTLGIPEFGTPFTIKLVEDTKPTSFGELIKISGLSHGTDVWLGNAQDLIANNIVPFKDTIGCRDDIMVYLMYNGVAPLKAFKIMEFVRKGRASKDPETWQSHVKTMQDANIPDWFIGSCQKIKYMFPKAHAAAYVISAFRIAWYKVHMPVYFYASWYSSKATDVDVEAMIGGYDKIKQTLLDIQAKGYEASNKENGQAESLKVALEATARGIKFLNVDLYESEATVWKVKNDTEIYPPFNSIAGLGDTVAKNIVKERENKPFLSIEDVQIRGKVSGTLIEKMKEMNILKDLPDSNQLSLF